MNSHSHKRRLDNFLQGIGRSASLATKSVAARALAPPSTTAAASSESLESLAAKRQRLGASTASYVNRDSPGGASDAAPKRRNAQAVTSSGNTAVSASTAATATATTASASPRPHPPAAIYCPADRGQLLARLATFQELTDWMPKPERVSEVEWAKKGWVCQGKERVKCGVCKKELVVGLNRREVGGKEMTVLVASEIEDALVEKYVQLMVATHLEDCPWRRHGCDNSLLRLPLGNPNDATASLRKRYADLVERKDQLPYEFNLRLPAGLDIDALISQLPGDFFSLTATAAVPTTTAANDRHVEAQSSSSSSSSTVNRVALALAMAGWQAQANPRPAAVRNTLSCHTCLRRLGLWIFKSKEVTPDGGIVKPAPMDHLDPVQEHRFFCPWRSAAAQRAAASAASASSSPDMDMAGWERLALVIRNEASIRNVAEGKTSKRRTLLGLISSVAPSTPGRGGGQVAGQVAVASGAVTPANTGVATVGEAPRSPAEPAGGGGGNNSSASNNSISNNNGDNNNNGGNNRSGNIGDDGDGDGESVRDAKEKAMYSRLRRIKSLFHPKGSSRLHNKSSSRASSRRASSRPGTSQSAGTAGDNGIEEVGGANV